MTALRAGFGSATITPPLPVFLAGFSARSEPALAVRDDLEARAVAVSAGDSMLVLVVCDLLGMSPDVALIIRSAIAGDLGCPVEQVLTASTHTHSGPNVIRGADRLGWATPEGYESHLVERCVMAARQAHSAREPVEAFFGRHPLPPGISHNRRDLPYDPTFAVLDFRRPDGSCAGTVANVGVHPVALGVQCLEVSTDWVGPFRAALEATTGGAAVMLQGALGDVNPVEPHAHDERGDFAHADAIGHAIAEAVADARSGGEHVAVDASGVRASARRITAPVDPTMLVMLTEATGPIDVELVEWALGSVRLVTAPGEAFHEFGRRLERCRSGGVLLAGLSPAWQGYLPVPYGDGYEESVSYGPRFVDAVLSALEQDPLR